MTDTFDDQLAASSSARATDPEVLTALSALAKGRSSEARHRRARRFVVPSIAVGAFPVLGTGGAIAATQWGPWTIGKPDLVIARDWTDVTGAYLGSCESRMA